MRSVTEFLRSTRVVEVLSTETEPLYGIFQMLLDSNLPGVKVVPIRSISADTFCVRMGGIPYIIWDKSYAATAMNIFETLLGRNTNSVVASESVALCLMADLLFDEGLYADAWITGSVGGAEITPMGAGRDPLERKPVGPTVEALTTNAALSFLFLHEVGHLLQDRKPTTFAVCRSEVEKEVNAYGDYLSRMPPTEKDAALSSEGFIFPGEGSELPAAHENPFLADTKLIEEATADLFAMNAVFNWLDGGACSAMTAVDVAESVLAVRIAAEIIRDIRICTRRVSIGERDHPPTSQSELMRGLLLRHRLLHTVGGFAKTRTELQGVGDEFGARYQWLVSRRKRIFGEVIERLVNFGLGQAREFRSKMERWPGFLGSDIDYIERYRDSYLRLRGWKSSDEQSGEQLLDMVPLVTGKVVPQFVTRLVEEFQLRPLENGRIELTLRSKDH
jgi:hypothetical protein